MQMTEQQAHREEIAVLTSEKEERIKQLECHAQRQRDAEAALETERAKVQTAVADAEKQSEDKLNLFGDELKIAYKKHETDEREIGKLNRLLTDANDEIVKLKEQLQVS